MPNVLSALSEERLAQALALRFSSPHGERNRDWDAERPDGPDNLYYAVRSLSERAGDSPYIVFDDIDGQRSMRVATFHELAAALVESGTVLTID